MKKLFHFQRRKPPLLWRAKWLLLLIVIGCLEVMPIPVTDSILIFVWLFRPLWFKRLVDKLYSHLDAEDDDEPFFTRYRKQHAKSFKS